MRVLLAAWSSVTLVELVAVCGLFLDIILTALALWRACLAVKEIRVVQKSCAARRLGQQS